MTAAPLPEREHRVRFAASCFKRRAGGGNGGLGWLGAALRQLYRRLEVLEQRRVAVVVVLARGGGLKQT